MFNWFTKTAPAPATPDGPEAGPPHAPAERLKQSAVLKGEGDKLFDEERFAEAAEYYRQAIAIDPQFAEAYDNLGIALWQQGMDVEAERCLAQAVALKPEMANTHYNLGSFLHQQGRLEEALRAFDRALALKPYFAEGHHYMGIVFEQLGRMSEAEASHRTARAQMLHQLQHQCVWNDLEAGVQFMRLEALENPLTDRNLIPPLAFFSLPGITAAEQKRYAQRYAAVKFPRISPLPRQPLPTGERKIRVGYLSCDFHDHATSRLMAEIFEHHDRSRFHITAYSYGADDGSAMRNRLESAFDQFVDIRDASLEDAARRIHGDRMDILVDLKGYTHDSRSGILAWRPAPIQVNYLGYPGTLGADFVDYLIADRFIIPPEHFQHYTEKVVWLPDCYQPNDRTRPQPPAPARSACGLPDDGFIFCSFNQTYKITPEVFDIWCRLLKAVPDSYLWLWASTAEAAGNLRNEAARRGVEPQRLIMAPMIRDTERHLARMQCADLFLDTFPVNAHTTCSDALWMGLPVVTCAGETFPSRVAGSLLSAVGVPELITHSFEGYYRLALALATDRDRLTATRNRIAANRYSAPLFDSVRFARNLEDVYARMADEHSAQA